MSGRKNVLTNFKLIDNYNMAIGSLISPATNVQFLDNISISLLFQGAGVGSGSFLIEVSNDGVNYTALDISPAMLVSDPDQMIIIDINQLAESYIRVHYLNGGDSGTLNAIIEGKAI
jgi:hypothetical protein